MSIRSWTLRAAAIAGLMLPAFAQPVSGTFLGFLSDGLAGQVRPLSGIAGATSLGKPVLLPGDATAAILAPGGRYGMFLSVTSGKPAIWSPENGAVQSVPAATPGATQILFSPTGNAAALYFAASHSVEVVSGLPADPGRPQNFILTPFSRSDRQIAVSDDGSLLLAEDGSSVVVLSPAGELNRISLTAPVTALAFAPGNHDVLVVSDTEAFLLADSGSIGQPIDISARGVAGATSAAFSADRKFAYFLRRGATHVAIYDLTSSSIPPVTLDSHYRLDGLFRLGAGETYLLNRYSGAPLRILDGTAKPPRIVIAPPALDSERQP